MMSKYLLLLFIPVIYGHIAIQIKAGRTKSDASIEFSGQNIEIITNKERKSFNIEDSRLKTACAAFSGGKPTDVFVKSPTPWGDVYQRFHWRQVQRVLRPVRSRVIGIHKKPVIVSTREFENYSQVKATYNADISHQIEETISKSWSISKNLTVAQDIDYSVSYLGVTVGGATSMSFTETYGKDTRKAKAVTLGTTTSVEVELPPGKAVVVALTAMFGTLEFEIDYEAYLIGKVFANYPNKFKDHYWWSYPITLVMKAADMENIVTSTEKISIGFYASARVVVNDKQTSSNVKTVPANSIVTNFKCHRLN